MKAAQEMITAVVMKVRSGIWRGGGDTGSDSDESGNGSYAVVSMQVVEEAMQWLRRFRVLRWRWW